LLGFEGVERNRHIVRLHLCPREGEDFLNKGSDFFFETAFRDLPNLPFDLKGRIIIQLIVFGEFDQEGARNNF